ncbi:MAG TPA: AAA family ATPase [Candidatus Saccharimonadales bacterium]|nr:AAA family ATPase [Candidatus Saccharimonadales bacterium]
MEQTAGDSNAVSTKPTLYLMMGFPGSGKTTTAKIIHDLTGAVHLWADQERRERFGDTYRPEDSEALYFDLNHRTAELLHAGKSVVFDTNFNFRKDRDFLRDVAAMAGADVKLIWLRTNITLAKDRATGQLQAVHNGFNAQMEDTTFMRIASNLELPSGDEQAIVLDGTKITPDYVKQMLGL